MLFAPSRVHLGHLQEHEFFLTLLSTIILWVSCTSVTSRALLYFVIFLLFLFYHPLTVILLRLLGFSVWRGLLTSVSPTLKLDCMWAASLGRGILTLQFTGERIAQILVACLAPPPVAVMHRPKHALAIEHVIGFGVGLGTISLLCYLPVAGNFNLLAALRSQIPALLVGELF